MHLGEGRDGIYNCMCVPSFHCSDPSRVAASSYWKQLRGESRRKSMLLAERQCFQLMRHHPSIVRDLRKLQRKNQLRGDPISSLAQVGHASLYDICDSSEVGGGQECTHHYFHAFQGENIHQWELCMCLLPTQVKTGCWHAHTW